jgi:hypothetical protein
LASASSDEPLLAQSPADPGSRASLSTGVEGLDHAGGAEIATRTISLKPAASSTVAGVVRREPEAASCSWERASQREESDDPYL